MIRFCPTSTPGMALGMAIAIAFPSETLLHSAKAETLPPGIKRYGHSSDKEDAEKAIAEWLKLNDEGNYEEAWNQASPEFKKTLTPAQWGEAATRTRAPLGKLIERKPTSASYTTIKRGGSLPLGGLMVVAQFDTRFENLRSAVETVTFQKDADGVWKASSYHIKPAS